jgi:hypothetical protein
MVEEIASVYYRYKSTQIDYFYPSTGDIEDQ